MKCEYISYRDGIMCIGDVESLLLQYHALALRVDEIGTLELLVQSEEENFLIWQDIQEIEQRPIQ